MNQLKVPQGCGWFLVVGLAGNFALPAKYVGLGYLLVLPLLCKSGVSFAGMHLLHGIQQ